MPGGGVKLCTPQSVPVKDSSARTGKRSSRPDRRSMGGGGEVMPVVGRKDMNFVRNDPIRTVRDQTLGATDRCQDRSTDEERPAQRRSVGAQESSAGPPQAGFAPPWGAATRVSGGAWGLNAIAAAPASAPVS